MVSSFVIALEAVFFVISILGSAVAIYELKRARKALSDALLTQVISWIMYSSFLLAIISAVVAINFLVSVSPEIFVPFDDSNYVTILFGLIWLTILCNIAIAMKIKAIGKTFGFKEQPDRELFFYKFFERKKKL
ncbi:MAG TPA: hypothetical protein VJI13_02610 [Candidatus Norongarragalinales archaeon]|nr:hypothetical protein [Candidatus Norongarragalinales archaeon]